jgi:hypothetical protein
MSFIHPELAIMGAGLAMIPVIIHFLHRRRFVTQPWAAMDFILAAYQRSRRRLHVEQWLLLALRVLVLVVLGMCAARPFMRSATVLGALGQGRIVRTVIVDNGFSMRALHRDGMSSFDAAKKQLVRMVEEMRAGESIAIVTSAAPGEAVLSSPISDSFMAMRATEQVEASWAMKDWEGASKSAMEALGDKKGTEHREIVILTDLAGIADFGAKAISKSPVTGSAGRLAGVDRLVIVDVGGESRENVALTGLETKSQVMGPGKPVRVVASVTNFGAIAHLDVPVVLTIDRGQTLEKKIERLGADQTARLEFDFVPARAGKHSITAKIASIKDDVLREDNQRDLALEIREGISVLMVDGRDAAPRAEQELFYFRTALESRAEEDGESGFKIKSIAAAELADEMLRAFDLVVLGNVKELSKGIFQRLTRYVESGGGLIVFCGERAEPGRYQAAEFMPVGLREIQKADDEKERLGIKLEDLESPVLSDFLGQQRSILGSAMTYAYWKIKSDSLNSKARVLLRLTNGDPLVVTSGLGRGRVVTWLTGANLAWTNLPAKPDYVPLMLNMTAFAAGDDSEGRNVRVGESIVDALKDAGAACEVVRPDKATDIVDAANPGGSLIYRRTEIPGFYQFKSGERTGVASVHVDERASDLRAVTQKQVAALLGDRAEVVKEYSEATNRSDGPGGTEPGPFLAAGLLLLLGCESLMAHRFGNRG